MSHLAIIGRWLALVLLLLAGCRSTGAPPACSDTVVDGRRIHYCLGGSGPVTVVLEADQGADHAVWDSVAPRLARFARVLSYDRAGLGRSDSATTSRTAPNVATELRGLLGAVGVRGPLVLVGDRRGGWYLRSFAERFPDSVRRLILVETPHEEFDRRVRAVLNPDQIRQLDSALAAGEAGLTPGARRERDDLPTAPLGTTIDVPVTMVRAGRHTLPIPTTPAVEALWQTLHDDSLARFMLNADVIDVGPVFRLDRPDSLVAIVKRIAAPPSQITRRGLGALEWTALTLASFLLTYLAQAFVKLLIQRARTRNADRLIEKDPRKILLWELVDRSTPARGRARALLEGMNRWAVERARVHLGTRVEPASSTKAKFLWDSLLGGFWDAQQSYIPPGCRIFDRGQLLREGDGVAAVRRWLEAAYASPDAGGPTAEIWITGAGGTGKTTFIHRLFLELIGGVDSAGAHPTPVPMLAAANNLRSVTEQITALQTGSDSLHAFVEVWLKHRVVVPAEVHASLVSDFVDGLSSGAIVLLLDGYDELAHQGLGQFAQRLLGQVRCWVAAQRSDHETAAARHERSVMIDDGWSIERIGAHLVKRWPDWPDARAAAERAIATVVRRAGETNQGAHWLCQPRNLDFYLENLIPEGATVATVPDEAELLRRAESEPYLFDKIVSEAVHRLADPTAKEVAIRDRLFAVAVNDPSDPRRRTGPKAPTPDDVTGRQVRGLGEILAVTNDRLYFKHAALREYFVAGRIAWELHDTIRPAEPGDELSRFKDEGWSAAKLASIAGWLHRLGGNGAAAVLDRLPRLDPAGTPLDPASSPDPDRPGVAVETDQRRAGRLHPNMLRNLVDLLVRLELDRAGDRRSVRLVGLDLSGMSGDLIDLSRLEIDHCSFNAATLTGADLTYARVEDTSFLRANLTDADAVGASFDRCGFGSTPADYATVTGMEIEAAEFTADGVRAGEIERDLIERKASPKRSRYRGQFGRKFFEAQKAFLGEGLERLENEGYVPAIEAAVAQVHDAAPPRPVYLVDLMAGGGYQRITRLREKYERLHILGVDRDPSAQPLDSRFRWTQTELGGEAGEGEIEFSLDLSAILGAAFADPGAKADLIVAKKALHEIDRRFQPTLIRKCAESLRTGGRLILFVDTPGPIEGTPDQAALAATVAELDALRAVLVDPKRDAGTVARTLDALRFEPTPIGLLGFTNAWILVKDWANLNRHEVRHRYFASLAEIRSWAEPWFGAPVSVTLDRYRLNPRIFNELGIQRVLHHLERNGADRAATIRRDLPKLIGLIGGTDRFRVLVDFTRKRLGPSSPLAVALGAREDPVDLGRIDPVLSPLNSGDKAPWFNLTCAVLVFEKRG